MVLGLPDQTSRSNSNLIPNQAQCLVLWRGHTYMIYQMCTSSLNLQYVCFCVRSQGVGLLIPIYREGARTFFELEGLVSGTLYIPLTP